jgi:DNA-binding NarL/FixJ family response regulator
MADRVQTGYWERRLFRNTFTYRGERREVAGWCVKLQWNGVRRTLRLASEDRARAAGEAAQIWADLRRGGWSGVGLRRVVGRGEGAGAVDGAPVIGLRKYVSDLNPGFHRELLVSVRLEGGVEHYALGTEDVGEARLRARELQGELGRDGPARFRLSHAREATIAVFWHANPMACTYTTLLTQPARGAGGGGGTTPVRARGWRVLVVESDAAVRRALASWLAQDAGVARVDGMAQATEGGARGDWDLVLANREQPASAVRALAASGGEAGPRLVTHGCFADSDAIFASFSGVSRGYVLCRVPPGQLLAPLTQAFPEGPGRGGREEERQIKRYFQSIFEPDSPAVLGQPAELTLRELEILDLLARGFADKEVGRELGISVWTVHSHLKRIFAKYGVRTRTEAVVRHLQK